MCLANELINIDKRGIVTPRLSPVTCLKIAQGLKAAALGDEPHAAEWEAWAVCFFSAAKAGFLQQELRPCQWAAIEAGWENLIAEMGGTYG